LGHTVNPFPNSRYGPDDVVIGQLSSVSLTLKIQSNAYCRTIQNVTIFTLLFFEGGEGMAPSQVPC